MVVDLQMGPMNSLAMGSWPNLQAYANFYEASLNKFNNKTVGYLCNVCASVATMGYLVTWVIIEVHSVHSWVKLTIALCLLSSLHSVFSFLVSDNSERQIYHADFIAESLYLCV